MSIILSNVNTSNYNLNFVGIQRTTETSKDDKHPKIRLTEEFRFVFHSHSKLTQNRKNRAIKVSLYKKLLGKRIKTKTLEIGNNLLNFHENPNVDRMQGEKSFCLLQFSLSMEYNIV